MIKVPNEDVLRAGVTHAELDLSKWDQGHWINQDPGCGTTACLAGHIVLASGVPVGLVNKDGHLAGKALMLLGFKLTDEESKRSVSGLSSTFEDGDTNAFYRSIFLCTEFSGVDLYDTPEAMKYFKERITEVTGIEL